MPESAVSSSGPALPSLEMLPKCRASLRAVSKPSCPRWPLCRMSAMSSSAPSASTPQWVKRSIGGWKALLGRKWGNRARSGFGQVQRVCANFDTTGGQLTSRSRKLSPRSSTYLSAEEQPGPSRATNGVRLGQSGYRRGRVGARSRRAWLRVRARGGCAQLPELGALTCGLSGLVAAAAPAASRCARRGSVRVRRPGSAARPTRS
jgi:hypothetical protein